MFDLEAMRRDREAGTPGPWTTKSTMNYGDRSSYETMEVWSDSLDVLVAAEVRRAYNDGGVANMRRIARVPDMEAALDRLTARLDAKTAEVERLREGLGHAMGWIDAWSPDFTQDPEWPQYARYIRAALATSAQEGRS